ncbi:MAG: ABC transporter substrate-binding protein [Alphaproteobacteria bacterium]|nr:ABC transporter substrate-binding protein [Alphaproteobacteria bacterium]
MENFHSAIRQIKFTFFVSLAVANLTCSENSYACEEGTHASKMPDVHAIAMHGKPKYGKDFTHFDYVNPDAPKGGTFRRHASGTFDTFNPFVVKGVPAAGSGGLFETLMASSGDEAFTEYGLVAENVTMPEDRSWVIFHINPKAKFHDGKSITGDDVIFSFNILREKGSPIYRHYYHDVKNVQIASSHHVRFDFKKGLNNRELPLILGQLPILPKHYWEGKDFTATTLTPPVGSGPYKVEKFEPGRFVVYKRDENYWGKDLAVNKGQHNFDRIRYDYYRDTTVALEAFKSGEYDMRVETEAKKWATAYDIPAVKEGKIKMGIFKHQMPSGMQGFVFNARREVFKDRRVREAIALAFDFNWTNQNLFFGQYIRTNSYFDNSDMAAKGLPLGKELKVLEKYREKLPKDVFEKEFKAPSTKNGSGDIRKNLRKAVGILKEAGWVVKNQKLVNAKTGEQFKFEIMINSASASAWERVSLPFIKNLKKLGVDANLRVVDTNQYQNRINEYNFDMIVHVWGQSLSPGNEQRSYWGSKSASSNGSSNYAGVNDEVIDELIERLVSSKNREDLVINTRALDRVLLWGHYVVPHWHLPYYRIAYWNKLGVVDKKIMRGPEISSWWMKSKTSNAK